MGDGAVNGGEVTGVWHPRFCGCMHELLLPENTSVMQRCEEKKFNVGRRDRRCSRDSRRWLAVLRFAPLIFIGGIVRTLVMLCSFVAAAASGLAQAPADLWFEAATIKTVSDVPLGRPPSGAGLYAHNYATVEALLIYAYQLPRFRIVGAPSWITTQHYEVRAKAAPQTTGAQMRTMMQRLLADRFALKVHREQRQAPTYNLVVARADRRLGPNITPAPVDCMPFLSGERSMAESPLIEIDGAQRPRAGAASRSRSDDAIRERDLHRKTDRGIATYGESSRHRPDGPTRCLRRHPELPDENLPPEMRRDLAADGVPLFTALTDQLGLKLESDRGSIEVLVIDHLERPTEN
jgi:hypothetical protein